MTFVNVVIVGAGPAGIGIASLLSKTDIDYLILEKKETGNSFKEWPQNMKMITPSFPSNAFGQMDLNSICELTSPAFAFKKEHLSGDEYAQYLSKIETLNDLNVETNTAVQKVSKTDEGWLVDTNQGKIKCKYLIWAAGEFDSPEIKNITGAEHCIHNSLIKSPASIDGDNFVIIGGYESGVQMAAELIKNNKKVTLINPLQIDLTETSDPSQVLSPYTFEKYEEMKKSPNYTEVIDYVSKVTKEDNQYVVHLNDGTITSDHNPICATGFSLVQEPIKELITLRNDGYPLLNEETDELHNQENIYLAGPSVRHDEHIFCFIYKFRQRFGVILEDILVKETYAINDIVDQVMKWQRNGLYLSDLSCCDDECVC